MYIYVYMIQDVYVSNSWTIGHSMLVDLDSKKEATNLNVEQTTNEIK
jgi:hypothetical protein